MAFFGKSESPEEQPVSRYFPVVTASQRDRIEAQRRINDSRKAAEKMWAPILARLQAEQRRMRYVKC